MLISVGIHGKRSVSSHCGVNEKARGWKLEVEFQALTLVLHGRQRLASPAGRQTAIRTRCEEGVVSTRPVMVQPEAN